MAKSGSDTAKGAKSRRNSVPAVRPRLARRGTRAARAQLAPWQAKSNARERPVHPTEFGARTPIPFFFRIVYLSNNYRDPLLRTIEHEFGLTRPEFSILICLHMQDGLSAIDVCGITAQPQNTVGRGVALLLEKDMITKTADSEDGRRYYLHLTPKGERAYQSFANLLEDANDRMVEGLTPREIEQLNTLLDKMCAAVVPMAEYA